MSTERKSPAWPQLGVLAPGEEADRDSFHAFASLGTEKEKIKLEEMKFSNLAVSVSLFLITY